MNQDRIFFDWEGNNWFQRNKSGLDTAKIVDWPSHIIEQLSNTENIKSIAELGCANGWRLNKLRGILGGERRYAGVDASIDAIENGRRRFPFLSLQQGILSRIPLQDEFDLIIVYFVLHWVDRSTLARSIAEIDRLIKDGGLLILGDFLPDYQQRRHYHHCPDGSVFTYKQDYARLFESLGTYRELSRTTFEHEANNVKVRSVPSSSRCFCSILGKSLNDYYPEISG